MATDDKTNSVFGWNGTENDRDRASIASLRIARSICPPNMLPYIDPEFYVDPESTLYDATIVGANFSRASLARQRSDNSVQGDITFRLIGPYWDRRLVLRFRDVVDYHAPQANHLGIGDILWLEFLSHEGRNNGLHVCRIHCLPYHQQHEITFRSLEFDALPNDVRNDDDFIA